MCLLLDLRDLRLRTFNHLVGRIEAAAGVRSIWTANFQRTPSVRALSAAGQLDRLGCLIASAKRQAAALGLREAVEALSARELELKALDREYAASQLPSSDALVLDPDWGRKGRGAKILAWIGANGANAGAVMARFQLAKSTAQRYVRRAKQQTARLAA